MVGYEVGSRYLREVYMTDSWGVLSRTWPQTLLPISRVYASGLKLSNSCSDISEYKLSTVVVRVF